MKIIVTESQSHPLLYNILEDIFKGYKQKYEGNVRNIYVDGNLLMVIGTTSATLDKSILNQISSVLFFENIQDIKDPIKEWIRNNFGVSNRGEINYGIKFQNLLGVPEPPKERKKPVRDKLLPEPKKSEEQIKREREGYSNFLKYKKDWEKKLETKKYKLDESVPESFKRRMHQLPDLIRLNSTLLTPRIYKDLGDYIEMLIELTLQDFNYGENPEKIKEYKSQIKEYLGNIIKYELFDEIKRKYNEK